VAVGFVVAGSTSTAPDTDQFLRNGCMPDPRRIQPNPDPDPYRNRGSADPELDSRGSGNIDLDFFFYFNIKIDLSCQNFKKNKYTFHFLCQFLWKRENIANFSQIFSRLLSII
jgi:hypothetical protein